MKFTINGRVTVSCFTTVEADTEEEARAIAAERELAGLCHMPFDADHDEAWHIETDGEPEVDSDEPPEER
jgi:hypothetical protein